MSSIGPDLPPHLLAKRKRREEQEQEAEKAEVTEEESHSPNGEKRRRVMGPAMPPASLDQLPQESPEEDDSSSDDGYGPALRPGHHESVSCSVPYFLPRH
jgi:hypothetical protein